MDYGNLFSRAWAIVWNHKYLIVLGVVAGLSGGTGSSSSSVNYQIGEEDMQNLPDFLPQFDAAWGAAAIAAIAAIVVVMLAVFLLVWALSQVAQGALIAGVEMIETGRDSSLGITWRAGWRRILTLLGIGLVPLIPTLLLIAAAVVAGVLFLGVGVFLGDTTALRTTGAGIAAVIIGVLCLLLPIMLFIGLLSNLAYRACMLEQTGVWASYRRGWEVLRHNLGQVLVIALLALVIGIGLFVVLLIPSVVMALCCLLWPLLLLIQGLVTAYFSTVWTLAWREWTAAPPAAEAVVVA